MLKVFQGFVMNLQEVINSWLCPETNNCFFQQIPVICELYILFRCLHNQSWQAKEVKRLSINPLLKVLKVQVNAINSLLSQERKEPQESSKTPSPILAYSLSLLSLYLTMDLKYHYWVQKWSTFKIKAFFPYLIPIVLSTCNTPQSILPWKTRSHSNRSHPNLSQIPAITFLSHFAKDLDFYSQHHIFHTN